MKILFIFDSTGNPRSSYSKNTEEVYGPLSTYYEIVRNNFKDYTFSKISFGGVVTKKLINEAQAYYKDWKPDIIIVQSGINDCKPSILNEKKKEKLFSNIYLSILMKKIIYNTKILKYFASATTDENKFIRDINIFRKIFSGSKVYWIEISSSDNLENFFPNILKLKKKYNLILKKLFLENFIEIEEEIKKCNGFLNDHLHFNKIGQAKIAEIIASKILK